MMFHKRLAHERGATMVMMAFSLVVLLGLAGLVIDGGRAYADRRQVQNSADSAALAGTKALNSILYTPSADESRIRAAVASSITDNGTNGGFDCNLVDVTGATIGSCPTADVVTGLPSGTAGVTVTARDTQSTSFMKVLGVSSFDASAPATATVQSLRGGPAPFVVCGYQRGDSLPDLLLPPVAPSTVWTINEAAIGSQYKVHGPSEIATCPGGGSGFKGWAAPGEFLVPGTWDTVTGDRSGQIAEILARPDVCMSFDGLDGCTALLPMCHGNNGEQGANFQMFCDQYGLFQIIDTSSGGSDNAHEAKFLGGSPLATNGQGGGIPLPNTARIIKLTE